METERERIDIVNEIHKNFGSEKPTLFQLATFILQLGFADGAAIASIVLASWAYLFPRDPEKSLRCRKKINLSSFICNRKIVHTEVDTNKQTIVQICEQGHKTIKRIK